MPVSAVYFPFVYSWKYILELEANVIYNTAVAEGAHLIEASKC